MRKSSLCLTVTFIFQFYISYIFKCRDTAKYHPLMKTNLVSHSLKYLTRTYLGQVLLLSYFLSFVLLKILSLLDFLSVLMYLDHYFWWASVITLIRTCQCMVLIMISCFLKIQMIKFNLISFKIQLKSLFILVTWWPQIWHPWLLEQCQCLNGYVVFGDCSLMF